MYVCSNRELDVDNTSFGDFENHGLVKSELQAYILSEVALFNIHAKL